MRIGTVRIVDRYAGIPLCGVLTGWRRIVRLFGLEKRPREPMRRLLFVKLAEQGATVLAYGAVERAASFVGRENVFFCVFEKNREILDILEVVPRDNVLTIRDDSLGAFVRDVIRVAFQVRRLGIDTAIDLEFFARVSAVLGYLTGCPRRVGLHRFTSEGLYRGDLLTHRVAYNPYLHTALLYDLLVQAAQRDPEETPLAKATAQPRPLRPPRFRATAEERRRLQDLLGIPAAGRSGPIVILNPKIDDVMPIRKWPMERYAALGNRLLEAFPDATVVVTGLPAEAAAAEDLARTLGPRRAVSLAGKLGFRELITLFTLGDVLVTSDSGPAHFAALSDIAVVVLFGPETPVLFGPLGDRVHVVSAGLACSPCLSAANYRRSPCRDNVCMQSISVDQVYDVVQRCLNSPPKASDSGAL